jgi:hypothetical protein
MMESLKTAAGVLFCLILPLALGLPGCWAIMTFLPHDVGLLVAIPYIIAVAWASFAITQSVTRYMNADDINRHMKQHGKED